MDSCVLGLDTAVRFRNEDYHVLGQLCHLSSRRDSGGRCLNRLLYLRSTLFSAFLVVKNVNWDDKRVMQMKQFKIKNNISRPKQSCTLTTTLTLLPFSLLNNHRTVEFNFI